MRLLLLASSSSDRSGRVGPVGDRETERRHRPCAGRPQTPSRTRRHFNGYGSLPTRRGEIPDHATIPGGPPPGALARGDPHTFPSRHSGHRPVHPIPRSRSGHVCADVGRPRKGPDRAVGSANSCAAPIPANPGRCRRDHDDRVCPGLSPHRAVDPSKDSRRIRGSGRVEGFQSHP